MALYTASSLLIFSRRSRLYARLTSFKLRPQTELLIIEVLVYSASPSAFANTKYAGVSAARVAEGENRGLKSQRETMILPRSRIGDYAVTLRISDLLLSIKARYNTVS